MSDSASITSQYVTAEELAKHEDHSPHVAHQFDDAAQQKEAGTLGMWAFLATEIMFFGGIFLAYSIYRANYSLAFEKASQFENWIVGGLNTFVLLFSSLTVVLAVHAAHHGNTKRIIWWIFLTIVFGVTFLGIKAWEYHHLYTLHLIPGSGFDTVISADGTITHPNFENEGIRRGAQIFFSLYFVATGIHALHMIIGVGLMSYIAWMAHKGRFSADYYNPVEISGLYWHFVDIVWIFLYPMLYLIHPVVKPFAMGGH